MSTPEPAHGTLYRYTHWKCLCDPCRDASNTYRRKVHRLRGYGRWKPLVDAGPARDHVNALRRDGIGTRRIAALAGVGHSTIQALIYGAPATGRPPTQRMRPGNAAAILAVRPSLADYAPTALVDATGTRRRLQALTALGWPAVVLSVEMERPISAVSRWRSARQVSARSAIAVRALYDRLWCQEPPASTPRQKADATKARQMAKAHGWPPPLAWDDDTIDDPAAVPHGIEPETTRARLPEREELLWLVTDCGETPEALAERFGVTVSGVRQAIHRARKREAVAA